MTIKSNAALKEMRSVLQTLGPPIVFRKLHGIMNAMEMQVEDGGGSPEALQHLGNAFLFTARHYQVPSDALQAFEAAVAGLAKTA